MSELIFKTEEARREYISNMSPRELADALSGRSVVPASNGIAVPKWMDDTLIAIYMDESDWNFVIDCLRHRARREPTTSDTADRANFTADTMQDVLDGAR